MEAQENYAVEKRLPEAAERLVTMFRAGRVNSVASDPVVFKLQQLGLTRSEAYHQIVQSFFFPGEDAAIVFHNPRPVDPVENHINVHKALSLSINGGWEISGKFISEDALLRKATDLAEFLLSYKKQNGALPQSVLDVLKNAT